MRQNSYDQSDFSCGLKIIKPDGQPLTLLRYNGGGHKHGEIAYACHIHRATHKAIIAGKKPEFHAKKTTVYRTLEGALACLLDAAAVSGIASAAHDAPDLFS